MDAFIYVHFGKETNVVGEKYAQGQMRLTFHPHFITFNDYYSLSLQINTIVSIETLDTPDSDVSEVYYTKHIN